MKGEDELENHIRWDYAHEMHCAYNKKGELLGELFLHMVGRHKHWCWRQESDVYMSPGCLEEVRAKQKELFKTRKEPVTPDGERR